MGAATIIAQGLWAAGNLAAAARFARALRDPERAQSAWLARRLAADADSVFGREHDFPAIRSYHDFARKVPMRDWSGFSPWIDRIRAGEHGVLGSEPVSHLAPTSGSSGARKLIPFTPSLHRAFAGAVGAWMFDLTILEPGILGGSAYWSISPVAGGETAVPGAVPVGFADDAEYLGSWQAKLARLVMAVPAGLRHEKDSGNFWKRTAACLLAHRDLRLISVWHPSFLGLIQAAVEREWDEILGLLDRGRAAELRRVGPQSPSGWWPSLRVVSCWGDMAAGPGMREIVRQYPRCRVQPKGLLATEAVVTIPWRGTYPLAVTSHFFEFLSDHGDVMRAHELERGQTYEMVVTNGGGLWRYRLGDMVACDGYCAGVPTLRFLGRAGNVSDLCGEKLTETFVAECFSALWPVGKDRPLVAYLHARPGGDGGSGYDLIVASPMDKQLVELLDSLLRANPHYDLARRLGQLRPLRLHLDPAAGVLGGGGDPRRLGDIKPLVLVSE
jgi:hypothetical protein